MTIAVERCNASRVTDVDFNNIPFGRIFADHMFEVDFLNGTWQNPRIRPYGNLSLSPALSCMHYGQAIFEGMKAQRNSHGEIILFRPRENWKRLNFSARRMQMPEIPEDLFMDALISWVKLDHNWVPTSKGSALYIRPLMIATDDYLGVKASTTYKFLIYGCPVSSYYTEPLRIRVEETYVRAAKGGVGEAKAAGNYAASMFPASRAQSEGFHQLLWTDAVEHRFIEELGTSNFFAVVNGELYTPETEGTILRGITRDSVIQVARQQNIPVHVQPITTDQLKDWFDHGELTEAFATGTAATIAPIGIIQFREQIMNLSPSNPITTKLHSTLDDMKTGKQPDIFSWNVEIGR
ncbi:MAG: branched-chain amino acid aminotransferase [Flavobacteriales bacterium]|nr:branched-chain amino acid aminotransferase [Bacteroidota bacterium]MCB9240105.1 branched-chain amino acid aminotransferase [Flavobacteriales bacterium]